MDGIVIFNTNDNDNETTFKRTTNYTDQTAKSDTKSIEKSQRVHEFLWWALKR